MNRTNRWSPVHAAAFNWWLSRRPVYYSPDEHLQNPVINCVTDEEKNLAMELARAYQSVRDGKRVAWRKQ